MKRASLPNPWAEDNARDEAARNGATVVEAEKEPEAPPPLAVEPTATERGATTATTPEEAKKETKAREVGKLRADLAASRAGAFGYGAARGVTLGAVDRLVGLGSSLGEHAGSTEQNPAEPGTYQKARSEYLAGEAEASRDYPKTHLAGELVGGVAPTVATAGVPIGRFGQAALTGGTAGALNTRSDRPLDIAAGGVGGAALGAAAEGTVGTLMRRAIRKAPVRKENEMIRDVMESEAGRATPTTGVKLGRDIKDVRDVLRSDPEVAAAVQQKAEKARPVIEQKVRAARAGQGDRYAAVDAALEKQPLTVTQLLTKLVEAEKDIPATRLPLVKRALQSVRDSLRNDWAPRWGGSATWQGKRVEISSQQLREWVSSAQAAAEASMGGINGTNAYKVPQDVAKICNGLLEERLDLAAGKGAREAVAGIRESDRVTSALLTIDRALEDRGRKELAQAAGLAKRLGNQTSALEHGGAAAAFVTGHPLAGSALLARKPAGAAYDWTARAINDKILAPLQLAADAGSPMGWAEFARMAAEQGFPQSAARALYNAHASKYGYKPSAVQAPESASPAADVPRATSQPPLSDYRTGVSIR